MKGQLFRRLCRLQREDTTVRSDMSRGLLKPRLRMTLLILLVLVRLPHADAAMFDTILKPKVGKCYSDEVAANALYMAEVAPLGTEQVKVRHLTTRTHTHTHTYTHTRAHTHVHPHTRTHACTSMIVKIAAMNFCRCRQQCESHLNSTHRTSART